MSGHQVHPKLYSLRSLGHVLSDERIPKDLIYSELVVGQRNVGRPRLRYKYVCKRDSKSLNVDIDEWEKLTDDRNKWRSLIIPNPKKKTKK